ncbi:MAG TPA: hypothetical protein VGG75_06220 [Trebonia sp.]
MLAKPTPERAPVGSQEVYDRLTAHLEPPFAVVDLDSFDANAKERCAIRRVPEVPAPPRPPLALPVVRRPGPGIATLFSGGYIASGTSTPNRLPQPFRPAGLRLTSSAR